AQTMPINPVFHFIQQLIRKRRGFEKGSSFGRRPSKDVIFSEQINQRDIAAVGIVSGKHSLAQRLLGKVNPVKIDFGPAKCQDHHAAVEPDRLTPLLAAEYSHIQTGNAPQHEDVYIGLRYTIQTNGGEEHSTANHQELV